MHNNTEEKQHRTFILQRVLSCWYFLQNLQLNSAEEKSLFITQILYQFRSTVLHNSAVCKGTFSALQDLQKYETILKDLFHNVYTNRNQFMEMVEKAMKNDKRRLLLAFTRNLPQDINLHLVQLQFSSLQQEDKEKLSLLSLFLDKKDELKHTALIPDLVNFYTWLYDTFSFLISEERAKKISMLALIELYSDQVEQTEGRRIMRLYQRLREAWNRFVEFSGGELRGGCVANIFPRIVHNVSYIFCNHITNDCNREKTRSRIRKKSTLHWLSF